jgi:hypothetical protein
MVWHTGQGIATGNSALEIDIAQEGELQMNMGELDVL